MYSRIIVVAFVACFLIIECHLCQIENQTTNGSQRQLHSVPRDLSSNTSVLLLQGNFITVLQNNIFESYANLIHLLMDYNRISIIEENAFSGLGRLEILTMSGNFLNLTKTYIKGVFKPLVSLLTLDIKHNMPKMTLSRTSYPYFGDLRKLSSLSLDLVSRPDFATSGLERLINLRKLVFDHCGIEQLYNETLLYI